MSSPRLTYAAELVEVLGGIDAELGVKVTVDPDEAAASLPAVLLVPPAVDFTAHEPILTWSLKLLTSSTAGGLAAWTELDELLDEVERLLPVEAATPGVYALSPDYPAVPCYSATLLTQGSLA